MPRKEFENVNLENSCNLPNEKEHFKLYKDIVCKVEEVRGNTYLIPRMLYKSFKEVFGEDTDIDVSSEDERLKKQGEDEVKILEQKANEYGFKDIDGEYKLQVYSANDFNMTKFNKKEYGISYGIFNLPNNEIIYAREILTGFADVPSYIQLTKNEYDAYIQKIDGNENIELPKIDERERIFCANYRNSGINYFSYNDVFHEEEKGSNSTIGAESIISVECFVCHTKFELNCSIPSNMKTFYCKCVNCDAELKIGNPNYNSEISTNREGLLKIMQLPNNIRTLQENEKIEILKNSIIKSKEILKNIKCDNSEYELSKRQQITKNNAMNNMKTKDYLQAYYEIVDFIENYGDNHNGKVYLTEKQEIYNLINMLFNEIKG